MSDVKKIRYIVIDVDGTLTDSGIYYDEYGNETKRFSTRDAAGFFAAREVGIKTVVLTGRRCKATERRMTELNVDFLFQEVRNKSKFLSDFMLSNDIDRDEIGYIGDDINDFSAMQMVAFVGCPKDSCEEVISKADFVSKYRGGYGAVRDIIEYLLRERGSWNKAIRDIYGSGV